jgi:hypothetical protein
MTASEIIAELPKLSEAARREILRRILELARKEEEIQFLDDIFVNACRNVDEREREDARRFLQESALQAFQAIDRNELEGGDRKDS